MRIYATYNIKGGVGKTTTAVNLAYFAAEAGLRTVLWDLDPQGAASFMFRVKPKVKGGGKAFISGKRPLDDAIKGTDFDNLDLMPADFTYRNMDLLLDDAVSPGKQGPALKQGEPPGGKPARKLSKILAPLADSYDAVFLDCPPSVSLVSENVLHAADTIVVPLIPTTLSVRTLEQLSDFVGEFKGHRPGIFAFFSMVDRRKKLHKEITEKLPDERKDVARTVIPSLSVVESMSVWRSPVAVIAPSSTAAKAYRALWNELNHAA
jgi:cellulose biosynthesis protein BcsQ